MRENTLDFLDKLGYEMIIKKKIKNKEKNGIVHSKEFKDLLKDIPYMNIDQDKIEKIIKNIDQILGDKNTYSNNVEKYYLKAINLYISDSIPFYRCYHIISGIKNIYDNLGKETADKVNNIILSTEYNEKLELMIDFLYYDFPKDCNKEYIVKVVDAILDCNDKNILKNLEIILNNVEKFSKDNNREYILKKVLETKDKESINIINILLNQYVDSNIKNQELITFLINLYSTESSYCKESKYFWLNIIKDKKLINTNDELFIRKLIILSENLDGNNNEKYELIADIIKNYLINFKDKRIRDYIIGKIEFIKNTESYYILNELIPLMHKLSDEKEILNIINSIEENGITKKLSINFINNN